MGSQEKNQPLNKTFAAWADEYFKDRKDQFTHAGSVLKDLRTIPSFKLWNSPALKNELKKWAVSKGYELNPPECSDWKGRCHDELNFYAGEMYVIKT